MSVCFILENWGISTDLFDFFLKIMFYFAD